MIGPNPVAAVLPRSAYLHIPFCSSKCFYCDFNSYPGMELLFDDYIEALAAEIGRAAGSDRVGGLDSVYFGGGTPTVLEVDALAHILLTIEAAIGLGSGCEITLEANPGTVNRAKLADLRRAGFNRLSLGVQSFDDVLLARIGRIHSSAEAVQAYTDAREAGFSNVGIDLIFALPGQTLTGWAQTLSVATRLAPEHIALYELSIEEGTCFADMRAQGRLDLPDEDARLAMYELAISTITGVGYDHYEVSNFALPGFRSLHNQVYWRNQLYYGFGAGATSYVGQVRARRLGDPQAYVRAIGSGCDAVEFSERLVGRAYVAETVIQGLRMLEGIDLIDAREHTGVDIENEFRAQIDRLVGRKLVEIAGGRLKVTHNGLLLMNDVAMEFLPG